METLDTYGHLWPDSDDETRAALDEVLAGVGGRELASDAIRASSRSL